MMRSSMPFPFKLDTVQPYKDFVKANALYAETAYATCLAADSESCIERSSISSRLSHNTPLKAPLKDS